MSTQHSITTGARVRIDNPRCADFNRSGTVAAVHHADTDTPSYVVQIDGESVYTSYGASELAVIAPPAPAALIDASLPLAHRANTDAPGHWDARLSALEALRQQMISQGYSPFIAGEYAIAHLDTELEQQAAAQTAAKRAAAVARAAAKAEYHLSAGVQVRRAGSGAYLVPSSQGNTTIYVVSADFSACTCPAGDAGRPCWHVEAARKVAAQFAPVIDAARIVATLKSRRNQAAA
jgi:hypothetical protein